MIRIALVALLALACAVPAAAQQYPDRQLNMLSGYPAGGSSTSSPDCSPTA